MGVSLKCKEFFKLAYLLIISNLERKKQTKTYNPTTSKINVDSTVQIV